MIIEIHPTFTQEEKIQFLTKLDYRIAVINIDIWEQWGNHDSQGNWITQTITCAVKDDEKPNAISNKIDDVFKNEIAKKIKTWLLN